MDHPALQSPDKHYVTAAQGWLDLGDTQEAENELNQVGYWCRMHPEVMMVRWKVVARMKAWDRSLDVARTMIRTSPDRPSGWVCLAYSLCHLDRNEEAKAELIKAHEKFPKVSAVPYFLARLSVKLSQMEEASVWLSKWNEIVESDDQRKSARRDPKLKALWAYLGEDVKDTQDKPESDLEIESEARSSSKDSDKAIPAVKSDSESTSKDATDKKRE